MSLDDLIAPKNLSRWQHLVLLGGVGASIAMALYLTLYSTGKPPMELLAGKADKDRIDLFAEQIHGVKFDSDGKLVETLQAQRLDHYAASGESVLAQPLLHAQAKDGKVWKITAITGTLAGENEIRLRDNVVIVDNTETLRFESDWLDYFSDKQFASTDAAVTLRRQADVTTALGMRADLNINRVELLRDVDSHFVGQ